MSVMDAHNPPKVEEWVRFLYGVLEIIMTDLEINHLIATDLLGWGYSESSDTYWIELGCCIGDALSFKPLEDEFQGNRVISELGLNVLSSRSKIMFCL